MGGWIEWKEGEMYIYTKYTYIYALYNGCNICALTDDAKM